ncbi:YihY/virulence factor BrkB family protein [Mycobacterium sp. 050134]|uniref:YihY/virulence factor BrkB family protein n=1 Tax=Mycobacterium sp. 050134 TaxID=3096111 RepID=UPI002EDB9F7C
MVGWLDRLQRRNRAAGVIIAVIYKYLDDQGGYLSALITYYGFVSLFPMLLLLTTGLGVVLAGRPDPQHEVLQSALSQFPVIGDQLHQPQGLSGGTVAVIVGVAGALYGGLGVGQAVQNAMDSVWAVPRNKRPNLIRSRVRSLLLLLVLGSAALAATVVSAMGQATGSLGVGGRIGLALAAVTINALICLAAFRVTTARELTYRQVVPGALAAAVVWQILQWFGAGYVRHTVKSASATNSVFALVLGLMGFLFLVSSTLVLCAEINVVLVERLYPRALLTTFSDDADLTVADRKTYTKKAKAERVKGFQRVSVKFGDLARKADQAQVPTVPTTPTRPAG